MSADLYHIELERSESISNLPQGKYIEPSVRGISTKIAFVDEEAVLVKEKGREILKISRPFPIGGERILFNQ